VIRLVFTFSSGGDFSACELSGHAALGDSGYSIPCAAVSALYRAFTAALEGCMPDVVTHEAPEPGIARVRLCGKVSDRNEGYLKGACDVFVLGVLAVQRDYPGDVLVILP